MKLHRKVQDTDRSTLVCLKSSRLIRMVKGGGNKLGKSIQRLGEKQCAPSQMGSALRRQQIEIIEPVEQH